MNRVCGPLYLRQVRQRTGMPLAFGGQVTDRVPRLSEFLGAQTNTLRGLNEIPGTGLGGYVVAHQRTVVMSASFPVSTIVVCCSARVASAISPDADRCTFRR